MVPVAQALRVAAVQQLDELSRRLQVGNVLVGDNDDRPAEPFANTRAFAALLRRS